MSPRRVRLLVPLVIVPVLAALAACGAPTAGDGTSPVSEAVETAATTTATEPATSADDGASASTAEATDSLTVVAEELQFTSTTLDGDAFEGADLAGAPSVLWFWAPWCPTCRAEAPEIAAAVTAHPGVTFVGVAAQDELPAMQGFVEDYDLDGFVHLADIDAAVWARFGVTYQPAFAFISPDGAVEVVSGRLSPADLDEHLTEISAG